MKLAKKQANAKQHPEAELLLFENYSHFSSTISSKVMGHILKNKQKNKNFCIHEIIQLIIMKMKMKMENDHIDTTYINLSLEMNPNIVNIICIKQHLSNI